MNIPLSLSGLDPGHSAFGLAGSTAAIIALVATASEVLAWLLSARGAATRHAVRLLGLLLVLASPALAIGVGRSGFVLVALPIRAAPPEPAATIPDPPPPAADPRPIEPSPAATAGRPPVAPLPDVAAVPPGPGPTLDRRSSLRGGLALAWLIGAVTLGFRLVHGLGSAAALRRRSRPVEPSRLAGVLADVREALGTGRLPPILEADGLATPVAAGVILPSVVLPTGLVGRLDGPALRDVLVHESAHALRRDGLVGLLQRLAGAFFWPHFCVHVLNRRLSRSREETCDDLVLRLGDAPRYARTLLLLAEGVGIGRGAGTVGMFERRWRLEDRVARALKSTGRATMTTAHRGLVTAAGLVLTSAAIAAAAIRPGRAEGPQAVAPAPADATTIEGTVVDEAGRPVAEATVEVAPRHRKGLDPARSGADGRFAVLVRERTRVPETVRASADGGERLVVAYPRDWACERPGPVQIVLKPSRPLSVRVDDAAGKPVAGASVCVSSDPPGAVPPATTDPAGLARLRLPADAVIKGVAALKDGAGFDDFLNSRYTPSSDNIPPPPEVTLTLDGARTVTVKVVDREDRPVPGVLVVASSVSRTGNRSLFNFFGENIGGATTDAGGIARLSWYPKQGFGNLGVISEDFVDPDRLRVLYRDLGDLSLVARLTRKARVSGRVINPDGSPAAGAFLMASGHGREGGGPGWARAAADGTYSIALRPEGWYTIGAAGPGGMAIPKTGVVLREGERREGLDLRLVEGTRFHGHVARGPGGAVPGNFGLGISSQGAEVPEEFSPAQPETPRIRESVGFSARIDADGNYEARLAPGEYRIRVPSGGYEPTMIRVDGTGELVRDFRVEGGEPQPLGGLVVDARRRPVAGASITVQDKEGGISVRTKSGPDGRFALKRRPESTILLGDAKTDGAEGVELAGIVSVPAATKEVEVPLGPAATPSGHLVDATGQPFDPAVHLHQQGNIQIKILASPVGPIDFYWVRIIEAGGLFRVGALVPGEECEAWLRYTDNFQKPARLLLGRFRVDKPGPIDLGTITVPVDRPAEAAKKGGAKP